MFISSYNQIAFQFVNNFNHDSAPNFTIIAGGEGLGKSVILDCLFQNVKQKIYNPVLIDACKYAAKYSYAAYNGELSSFRKHFRSSKLILIDNINRLQGKKKTIEELFHTLDAIISRGGKAVITYCGNDLSLDFLGSRFASRLRSGLVIRLKEPAKDELNSFLEYYLDSIQRRDLMELFIDSQHKNLAQIIDSVTSYLEKAAGIKREQALGERLSEKTDILMPIICEFYGVEATEVLGNTKKTNPVKARYMMYLLLHKLFHCSYNDIGMHFNKKPSGIQNGCRKLTEGDRESFETLCHKLYNQIY